MTGLARLLGFALLLGTVLLGIGALMHPALQGDGATQLRVIAATPHWRAIHLVLLAGAALVIAGIWVRLLLAQSHAGDALFAALAIVAIGEALNALNIAYMTSAGTQLAQQFAAGDVGAAKLYDATHPIGLMAARFGNFLVSLGAVVLGLAEWQDGSGPRFFAALAWLAAGTGFIGVLFFDEASRFAVAAVAMLSAWQLATGIRAFQTTSRSHRP